MQVPAGCCNIKNFGCDTLDPVCTATDSPVLSTSINEKPLWQLGKTVEHVLCILLSLVAGAALQRQPAAGIRSILQSDVLTVWPRYCTMGDKCRGRMALHDKCWSTLWDVRYGIIDACYVGYEFVLILAVLKWRQLRWVCDNSSGVRQPKKLLQQLLKQKNKKQTMCILEQLWSRNIIVL